MLLSRTVETIVIQDNNGPDTLIVWAVMLLLIFFLYLAATLIHDINREEKIERLKKEREEKLKEKQGDDIDI